MVIGASGKYDTGSFKKQARVRPFLISMLD